MYLAVANSFLYQFLSWVHIKKGFLWTMFWARFDIPASLLHAISLYVSEDACYHIYMYEWIYSNILSSTCVAKVLQEQDLFGVGLT